MPESRPPPEELLEVEVVAVEGGTIDAIGLESTSSTASAGGNVEVVRVEDGVREPGDLEPFPVEEKRYRLAWGVVAFAGGVVFLAFATLWALMCKHRGDPDTTIPEFRNVLTLTLSPIMTMLSGALGFYFGGKTAEKATSSGGSAPGGA